MLDVSRTRYQLTTNKLVSTVGLGINGILDGQGLVSIIENGVQKVQVPVTAAATDVFEGVAFSQYRAQAQSMKVEEFKVPTGGGSVVLSATPVGAITTIGIYLAGALVVAQATSPANAGEVQVVGNTMTFNAGDAGKAVVVMFKYNISVAEIEGLPFMGDGVPGIAVTAATDSVSVIQKGEIFTDQFDASVNWNSPTKDIKLASGGIFSRGSTVGATVNGTVCYVPTVDCPFLGIELF